jgi:hypothetical protein
MPGVRRALVGDRWDSNSPAVKLSIRSLWFYRQHANGKGQQNGQEAYQLVTARKERAWLTESSTKDYDAVLTRGLDDLRR